MGLGEISVDSGLHERFAASIPLLTPTDEQRKSLSVHIANADAFQRAGIERTDYLSTLRFRLLDTPNGTVVLIDSDEIIAEPFLNLIVQADWGNGSLLREYSVLFDPPKDLDAVGPAPEKSAAVAANATPPKAAEPAPAVVEAAKTTATTAASPAAAVVAAPIAAAPPPAAPLAAAPTIAAPAAAIAAQNAPAAMPAPAEEAATPGASANGFQYGPVRAHEQPRSIAARLHPNAAVSRDQVELALFKANPQAFAQGRLDRLIPGSMLNIPSPGMIEAASPAAATAAIIELRAHLGAAHRGNVAARKAPAAARPSGGAPAKAASPVLASAPESRAPAVPQAPVPVPVPAVASAPPAPLHQPAATPQQPAAPVQAATPAKPVVAAASLALAPPVPAPVYADAGKPADALRLRMAAWLIWACSGLSLLAALAAMLLANTRSQSRPRGGARIDPARSAKIASARLPPLVRPAVAFSPPPAAAIPAIRLPEASPVRAPLTPPTRVEAPAPAVQVAEIAPAADASPSVTAQAASAAPEISPVAAKAAVDAPVAEHTASETALDSTAVLAEAELCQLYGQFAGAAALLEGAVRQAPLDAKLRLKLAEAYYAAGMVEEFKRTATVLRGLDPAMQQSLDEMTQTLSAQKPPAESPLSASTPDKSVTAPSNDATQVAVLPAPAGKSAASDPGPRANDDRLPTDPVIEQLQWFLDEPAKPQAKTGPEAPLSVARLPKNRRRSRTAKPGPLKRV